tara:strand:- start:166 stop:399 length:234 start_codon:yes stop_codon:yes gene_type:complete
MADEFKLSHSLDTDDIETLRSRVDELEGCLKESATIQAQLAQDMCAIHQVLQALLTSLQFDTDSSTGAYPVDKELLN